MELRPYQQEMIEAVYEQWKTFQSCVVIAATGTGKSHAIAGIAGNEADYGNKVLILAQRGEIIEQNAKKLQLSTGHVCAIEKAEQTSIGSYLPIVHGSVQTMSNDKRLQKFSRDHFQVIIQDEVHHANSATHRKIYDYFSTARRVGFTATANMRSDKKNLGEVFEALAYEYPLKKAIEDGYLCKIVAQTIPINIDLTQCKKVAGDYNAGELGDAIDPYLEQVAGKLREIAFDRKIVIFVPLIRTSLLMTDFMRKAGFSAEHIDGKSADRKELLRGFHDNRFSCLINSSLLLEGWDQPDVDCICVLRPTQSKQLYFQAIGRGTRLHPGKENLLLVDPLWLTAKHHLVTTPVHLVAESEEIAERMQEKAKAGGCMDIEDMEQSVKQDMMHERESKLARYLDANKHKRSKTIDPLAWGIITHDDNIIDHAPVWGWEKQPATDKQIAMLEKAGFDAVSMTKGYASKIIDGLMKRRESELATAKQVNLLVKNGYGNAATFSFEQANKTIDWLSENRWNKRRIK